jgi:hypothetical protein
MATDPSLRERVLEELERRASMIRTANGFSTDAGFTVVVGDHVVLGPEDPESAVAIVPKDDQAPTYQGENIAFEWPIEVQAHTKADINRSFIAVERLVADIKRAIEGPDRNLGGLLVNRFYRGGARQIGREPGSTTVGAALTYFVPLIEKWGEP